MITVLCINTIKTKGLSSSLAFAVAFVAVVTVLVRRVLLNVRFATNAQDFFVIAWLCGYEITRAKGLRQR
jgi:hypothetical protein